MNDPEEQVGYQRALRDVAGALRIEFEGEK
jgi:hypothetical protein